MVKFTDFAAGESFKLFKDKVLPAISEGIKNGLIDFGNDTEAWLKGDFTDFWEADLPGFFRDAGGVIGDGTKDFFTGKLFR